CPTYTAAVFEELQKDPSRLLLLEGEGQPELEPAVARIFPNRRAHDPRDLSAARDVAAAPEPVPIGVLFRDPTRPRYEEFTQQGLGMSARAKLDALERELDRFAV